MTLQLKQFAVKDGPGIHELESIMFHGASSLLLFAVQGAYKGGVKFYLLAVERVESKRNCYTLTLKSETLATDFEEKGSDSHISVVRMNYHPRLRK